jgi:Chaperone of endosialidase
MKTTLFPIILILFSVTIFAQNIGINVTNPKNPLHIKGRTQIDGRLSINQERIGTLGGELTYPIFEAVSANSDSSDINLVLFENSGFSPFLNIGHSRGTKNVPLKLEYTDGIFSLLGHAYDGTDFKTVGGIELKVDSITSVGNIPTSMDFYTSKNGLESYQLRMRLDRNGNLGIGTSAPVQAKLVVNGFTNYDNTPSSYGFLKNTGTGTNTNTGNQNYSIYASNRIAATEFNAFSDTRIKKIKGISNNQHDLETLMKLQITDYQLIDSISKGNISYKKVIAQQVEEVYPQAVGKLTDCIPDIYQLAKIENGFVSLPNHNLKVGEKVKLIFEENQEVFEVKNISRLGFQISEKKPKFKTSNQQVFVFGREVSDFRTVDYEALTTLNISATQEILKKIIQLEKYNNSLKTEINEIKADIRELKSLILK